MSDETANLILEYMRRFDARLDRMESDLRDIKGRTTGVEEQLVRVNRRLDRLDDRVDRIETRLNLVEG